MRRKFAAWQWPSLARPDARERAPERRAGLMRREYWGCRKWCSLKANPGIDDDVNHVGENIADEHQHAIDYQNAEGDRIVALQDRGVAEVAHAVDVEDFFDQER